VIVLILLAVVLAAAVLRFVALPRPVVVSAARDVRATIRGGVPYAYQYVLTGAGGKDVGDHDKDKLVVRADRVGPAIVLRVAPVDRSGRRTGRSRILGVTR
jgi:hypothetical protein